MNMHILSFRLTFLVVALLSLPILVTAVEVNPPKESNGALADKLSNTFVVVEKIIGSDDQGNLYTIYHYEGGRRYRLDDMDQVVLDLNAHKIKLEGTFWSLQAILGNTVYLMGVSDDLQPTLRIATEIPERLPLAVDNLKITKDHVLAVYTTNCNKEPI